MTNDVKIVLDDNVDFAPCYIEFVPVNREQHRKAVSEILHNQKYFFEIRDKFETELFDENHQEYRPLYEFYLSSWHKIVKWLRVANKIKYTKVDEFLFAEYYRAEQPISNFQIICKLRKIIYGKT